MRLTMIAGNWKMNMTSPQAIDLAQSLVKAAGNSENPRIVVCPPFTALSEVSKTLKGSSVYLGAQNMYAEESGAYTGEISPSMLLTTGVSYVILGHSERREYFSETDNDVNAKARLALKSGLLPIVCVGEKLEDRESGKTEEVVGRQIDGSLAGLADTDLRKTVIAYEPVWAIGTGKTATPEMAQDVHHFIRKRLETKIGGLAEEITILYGGSMKGENAAGLIAKPDIDGGLIGGASLKAEEFVKIINAV